MKPSKPRKLSERQLTIITMCQGFEALERQNTDLAGWLQLKLSVSREEAEKLADWYRNR